MIKKLSIDSFKGRYIILSSATLRVNDASHTPQHFGPVGNWPFKLRSESTVPRTLFTNLLTFSKRSLVARTSGSASDSKDVWIEMAEEL